MSRPPGVADILRHYETGSLQVMIRRWTDGDQVPAQRSDLIGLMVEHLSEGAALERRVGGLDPVHHLLLALALREKQPSWIGIDQVARALGWVEAGQGLRDLVELGLLLVLPDPQFGHFRLSELDQRAFNAPMVLCTSQIKDWLRPAPVRWEELPAVPAAGVLEIRSSDANRLARALVELVALCGRLRIQLTDDGWLPPSLGAPLTSELSLEPGSLESAYLVELAQAAGLLVLRDQVLVPSPAGQKLSGLTVASIVSDAYVAGLTASRWPDDLGANAPIIAYESIRRPPPGDFSLLDAGRARGILGGLLRRLRQKSWMEVDDFAQRAFETDPELLFGLRPPGPNPSRDENILSPRQVALQWNYSISFLLRTACWFGLVEVGRVGPSWPAVQRPTGEPRVWAPFRDEGRLYLDPKERDKPLWQPEPSGLAFRFSPFGREVLHGEKGDRAIAATFPFRPATLPAGKGGPRPAAPVPAPAPPAPPLAAASPAAAPPASSVPPAPLASPAPAPVPLRPSPPREGPSATPLHRGPAILFTGFDLAECSDGASRAEALADLQPVALIGDRYAILVPSAGRGFVIDYGQPPPRCIRIAPDGEHLHIDPGVSDLLVETGISLFTEAGPDLLTRRLTRASVQGSRLGARTILTWLNNRALEGLNGGLELMLRAWKGDVGPVSFGRVTVLQLAADEDGPAMLMRPELQSHLIGMAGPDMLMVRPGHEEALREALTGVGIQILDQSAQLTSDELEQSAR